MDARVADRIRRIAHERLEALRRSDADDVRVAIDGDAVVLEGAVDDAFGKSIVEQIARENADGAKVTSRLRVRCDLAAEAAAKETEFGDDAGPTKTIPRPEQ